MFIILTIIYFKKRHLKVCIIHQNDPEYKMGTFGQFIYDFNCIMDSQKKSLILYCNWAIRATQYGSSIAQNQLS
jgi:hypothetical protein